MSSSGDDAADADATGAEATSGGGASGSDDGDDGAPGTDDAGDGNDGEWWQRSDPEPPSIGPEAPEVDIPEVEVPGTGEPAEPADVDVDTAKGFWRLVLVFDVALLALALGPMVVYFEGDLRRGGMLAAFGALVFVYGVVRYREFRAEDDIADESPADDRSAEDGPDEA